MSEQKKSVSELLISNIVPIIGIVVLILVAITYFVKEPITAANVVRNVIGQSIAFVTILTTLTLLQRHTLNIIRKARGEWQYSAITVLSCLVMFVIGVIQTTRGATYTTIFWNTVRVGTVAIVSAIAFSIIACMFRRVRVRSALSIYVIAIIVLSFLTFSPVGEMVFPPAVRFGELLSASIVGASDAAYWTACYIGAVALVARYIMLKEKFVPTR
jgi:hypothetical protein